MLHLSTTINRWPCQTPHHLSKFVAQVASLNMAQMSVFFRDEPLSAKYKTPFFGSNGSKEANVFKKYVVFCRLRAVKHFHTGRDNLLIG